MCIFWRSHAQRTEILYTEEGEREMMNPRASIATAAKQDAACCRCLLFLFFWKQGKSNLLSNLLLVQKRGGIVAYLVSFHLYF